MMNKIYKCDSQGIKDAIANIGFSGVYKYDRGSDLFCPDPNLFLSLQMTFSTGEVLTLPLSRAGSGSRTNSDGYLSLISLESHKCSKHDTIYIGSWRFINDYDVVGTNVIICTISMEVIDTIDLETGGVMENSMLSEKYTRQKSIMFKFDFNRDDQRFARDDIYEQLVNRLFEEDGKHKSLDISFNCDGKVTNFPAVTVTYDYGWDLPEVTKVRFHRHQIQKRGV